MPTSRLARFVCYRSFTISGLAISIVTAGLIPAVHVHGIQLQERRACKGQGLA